MKLLSRKYAISHTLRHISLEDKNPKSFRLNHLGTDRALCEGIICSTDSSSTEVSKSLSVSLPAQLHIEVIIQDTENLRVYETCQEMCAASTPRAEKLLHIFKSIASQFREDSHCCIRGVELFQSKLIMVVMSGWLTSLFSLLEEDTLVPSGSKSFLCFLLHLRKMPVFVEAFYIFCIGEGNVSCSLRS